MNGQRELEALRTALRAADAVALPTETCPPPEVLWSSAAGASDAATTRAIVLHIASCGSCSEAWRLAKELDDAAGVLRGVPRGTRVAKAGWSRPVLGAAAAVLALGAFLAIRNAGLVRPVAAYRASAAGETIRAAIADGAAMPRSVFLLRWVPGPEGTRYDVEVARDDLSAIAGASGLDRPEYAVPVESMSGVPAGARIIWRVSATLPDGRRIKSAAFLAIVADGPRR